MLESGGVPIADLARLAKREGQSASAIYRVHRWFARRLGSQFRGILVGLRLRPDQRDQFWSIYNGDLNLRGAVVLDAFVGGGTSVVEASRSGARVIGYDIDPVATFITRFELAAASYAGLPNSVRELCEEVSAGVAPFHTAVDAADGPVEVIHHFWVEVGTCVACSAEIEIHPRFQLAYDAAQNIQWAFCRACHAVQENSLDTTVLACPCGAETQIEEGPLRDGRVHCPVCKSVEELAARGRTEGEPPMWRLFAQEYVVRGGPRPVRRFRRVDAADHVRYHAAQAQLTTFEQEHGTLVPSRLIPVHGRMDGRPLIHGIKRYRQLFNARQLLHLSRLALKIRNMGDPAAKRLLAVAFSEHLTTNCMYAGYAFGYRRISPMFSIHGYRHITRPVELNPWLCGIGRGTFPNVMRKLERAILYAKTPTIVTAGGERSWNPVPVGPADGRVATDPSEVFAGRADAAICTQSSAHLDGVPDGSVDLILTDPPYLDNISYSELSDFYLAWHQTIGVAEAPYDDPEMSAPLAENLAANRRGDLAIRRYRDELTRIFRECSRVLRRDGVCVFTYHHVSPRAWDCVAYAMASSGMRCTAVVPLRGEGQGGLHTYEGTIKWDAVLVCRPGGRGVVGGDLGLPTDAIARARERLEEHQRALAEVEGIGFAEPDRLNLFRALLVAEATLFPTGAEHGDLSIALAAGLPSLIEDRPAEVDL